jgi:hypothetical protein
VGKCDHLFNLRYDPDVCMNDNEENYKRSQASRPGEGLNPGLHD